MSTRDEADYRTLSGRVVKPSFEQIESKLSRLESEFLSCVGTVKDVSPSSSTTIREKKQELRTIWRDYEHSFETFTDHMRSRGHKDLTSYNSSFVLLRKSYKNSMRQLSHLLEELGEEVSSLASSSVECAPDSVEEGISTTTKVMPDLHKSQLSQANAPTEDHAKGKPFLLSRWLSDTDSAHLSVRPRVSVTNAPIYRLPTSTSSSLSTPIMTRTTPSLHRLVSHTLPSSLYSQSPPVYTRSGAAFQSTTALPYPSYQYNLSPRIAGSAYNPTFESYSTATDAHRYSRPECVTWADQQNKPNLCFPSSGPSVVPNTATSNFSLLQDGNSNFFNTSSPSLGGPSQVDATSRHIELSTLKREPSNPYKGEPHRFMTWITALKHRMDNIKASPMDRIDVLEAQSTGEVRRAIQTYRSMYGFDPAVALDLIVKTLCKRFGSPRIIAHELKSQLTDFPHIRGSQTDNYTASEVRRLSDLCNLINAQMKHVPDLEVFNYESELAVVRSKLPAFINHKWQKVKGDYIIQFGFHPKFCIFCEYLERISDQMCSDIKPHSFIEDKSSSGHARVFAVKTDLPIEVKEKCLIHKSDNHETENCDAFLKMAPSARKLLISSHNRCFRCMGDHFAAQCNETIKCGICNRDNHVTLLHQDYRNPQKNSSRLGRTNTNHYSKDAQVLLARDAFSKYKSCGKTVLVDISTTDNPTRTFRTYCIIDDQSTHSFATAALYENLQLRCKMEDYSISTLNKVKSKTSGRVAKGLLIKGVGNYPCFRLPSLYENNNIPNSREEIATPSIVQRVKHLSHLAEYFRDIDEKSDVCVLLGRDAGDLLACDQRGNKAPFACRTPLGWSVVGIVCPFEKKWTENFSVLKTQIEDDHFAVTRTFAPRHKSVFLKEEDDELPGLSIQDKAFMKIMENNLVVSKEGNIQAPLPFKQEKLNFPDNKIAIYRRQKNCLDRLKRDTKKLSECLSSMAKYISAKHVERVPNEELEGISLQTWYIPIFPVLHPRKGTLRLVFDSAASFQNVSLNSTLMKGPDQNNTLRGVLIRFREGVIGFVADVESMFHSFQVSPEHRDTMRFFWYKDNDPQKELVQYRACVHIFGNTCSPAVATMALRTAADNLQKTISDTANSVIKSATVSYIYRNFYVDDGLGTASSPDKAIAILKMAKSALAKFNIRLCKITSNDKKVPEAFPASERSTPAVVEFDDAELHRTLGVAWDVLTDQFIIKVTMPDRPFTKRGILAIVNSIYDPIGLASPIVLQGRLIQRTILPRKSDGNDIIMKLGWDDPLPEKYYRVWQNWKESLVDLDSLTIPRSFTSKTFGRPTGCSLHAFCDASKDAIGNVVYLRFTNNDHSIQVAFLCADSKVAPRGAVSIPRLELCAAVEVSLTVRTVLSELTIEPDSITFYSDSLVLLGYLNNEEKRFSRYVERRIELIRRSSHPKQWKYISSELNPADLASRPMSAKALKQSEWFSGPGFLFSNMDSIQPTYVKEELPEQEEVRMTVLKTSKEQDSIFETLLRNVGQWTSVLRVVSKVLQFVYKLVDSVRQKRGFLIAPRSLDITRDQAMHYVIKDAQRSSFSEIFQLKSDSYLNSQHRLAQLSPVVGHDGLIRVGGRLRRIDIPEFMKHPIILPFDHPVSLCILSHYHKQVLHQGRYITHGALRDAGFHVENGRKMLRKLLNNCITCKKLRGRLEVQRMSDLPPDRLARTPPFTNTGLDVMGPWIVKDGRKSRTSAAEKKSWALILTCLVSRAIHIEMLQSLDTPTFKNALRRFLAVRGPCKLIRSDRGTNFVGAHNEDIDVRSINADLDTLDCRWEFNPPHSSHFGGVWERMIGQLRRILDSSLIHVRTGPIERDDLHTLLVEACAIINNTPLWEVSTNAEDPQPLTPNMLLTLKDSHSTEDPNVFTESDISAYGKKRWRRVQFLADKFWQIWRSQYLQSLQFRKKWLHSSKSLEIGDVVLLRDKTVRRNSWPMGSIEHVNRSQDGIVRSATVKIVKTDSGGCIKLTRLVRPV